MQDLSDRHVQIAGWVVIGINALFLFVEPLLPFTNLPNHLAEAAIYKHYNDSHNLLFKYYQPVPWFFPNTFHASFCSLFPTVELGNKIFLILYVTLLPLSLFLVIRHFHGNLWYGFLGLLFVYNYNVTSGYMGFAISIPIVIILFYTILLDFQQPNVVFKIAQSSLLILLFMMHVQNALFGLLLFTILVIYRYGRFPKKAILHLLFIPLPLIALLAAWWFSGEDSKEAKALSYLVDYYSSDYLIHFIERFQIVVNDNFQLLEGVVGKVLAGILFSFIVLPLLFFGVWRKTCAHIFSSKKTAYPAIFFLTSLGCYLLLPDKIPGQSPVFQRFCTMVIFSFIMLASIGLRDVQASSLKIFVVAAVFCSVAFWFEYIHTFNRENKNFSVHFFTGIHYDSRLAGLIYENKYRGRKVYIHFPSYFLVWSKGIVATKIIDYRFGIIRKGVLGEELPAYDALIGEQYKTLPDYTNLDYILVRGKAPVATDTNLLSFSLTRRTGNWQLYRNKDQNKDMLVVKR